MRSTSGAFNRYVKGYTPTKTEDVSVFLDAELLSIQNAMNDLAEGFLEPITVAPAKPRDGMLRYAMAGVLGAGVGFYGRENGVWVKL